MRVIDAGGGGGRDDRGAVMVMFAAFIVVAVVFASFVIDIGNLRAARASLENATDSAALGAGQGYAAGEDGCASDADRLLLANDPDAQLVSCTSGSNGDGTGWVTVAARRTVDFEFGQAVGVSSGSTRSTTTVRYSMVCEPEDPCATAPVADPAILRPLGICSGTFRLNQWRGIGRPTGWNAVEIPYLPQQKACGVSTGEFLVVDFDGGNSPTSDFHRWNANGFGGTVTVGDRLLTDQRVFTHGQQFQRLVGKRVALVVYDSLATGGKNNKSTFAVVSGFLIVDVLVIDDTSSDSNRSITLRFVSEITSGSCCSTTPGGSVDAGRVLEICDVDGTMLGNCRPGGDGS